VSAPVSLRRNTLWTTLGQLSTVGLQAIYFVLICRTLGSYDYGLFVGVYSFVAVLSPYSALGFGMIMLRDGSRDPTRLPVAWGKSLRMLALGSAVIITVSVALSRAIFHRNLLLVVLCIAFSEAFCVRTIELAGQAFQAVHRLAWTARLNTLMGGSRTIAALVLALYCKRSGALAGLLQWTLLYTLFSFLSAVIALAIVHRLLTKPAWRSVSRKDCGEGLSFALSNSSYSIYNDIDKTMLASYGFIEAAGTYAAAYRIIEVATAPIRAVYTAAMPTIFTYGKNGGEKVLPFVRYLLQRTGLYALLAFAVMIWTAPMFPHLVGHSYAASVPAIRLLALIPLLRSFHYSAGNALTGCTSQWYRTSAQLLAAGLNLGLNLLLIPHWSWKGAAIASLITDGSLGAMNWVTLLYLYRQPHKVLLHATQSEDLRSASSDLEYVPKKNMSPARN
jgi:O-antigen/teichoic acid export membrane protein